MENWKSCLHEPRYLISSTGRVRDTRYAERFVSQHKDKKGYLRVNIHRSNGKWECIRVHLLQCYAFHGLPPTDHHEAAHHDDEKNNNTPTNVYWKTRRENIEDKIRHGRATTGQARALTDEQVVDIAKQLEQGATQRAMATKYGVAKGTIQSIKERRHYARHLLSQL